MKEFGADSAPRSPAIGGRRQLASPPGEHRETDSSGRPEIVGVDRQGTGPPLVLVHGLGSRRQIFDPVTATLAEHRDVIRVDLPGFGDRPVDHVLDRGVDPSPDGYATWLADLLGSMEIESPHVVGSSMGGGVALELGRRGLAGRVTAFSPIGFWNDVERRWCAALLTSLRATAGPGRPVVARALHHAWGRAALLAPLVGRPAAYDPEMAMADVDALVACSAFGAARRRFAAYVLDERAHLGHLRDIPVTIAWGTRDAVLIHRTQSARARRALPFARHVDLPGCGHLPFNDDPARCVATILAEPGTAEPASRGSS